MKLSEVQRKRMEKAQEQYKRLATKYRRPFYKQPVDVYKKREVLF